MTQDEAIKRLQSAGLHAFFRRWSLGDSIGVASGAFTVDGITAYRQIIYIYPLNALWCAVDLSLKLYPNETKFDSLESAVEHVSASMPAVGA
jgi:hypothetical protein